MYCTRCGNKLEDDDKFCMNCGTPNRYFNAQPENVMYPSQASDQEAVQESAPVFVAPSLESAAGSAAPKMADPAPFQGYYTSPVSIVPAGKNIRYKCSCGAVQDTKEGAACSKCGRPQADGCGYYKLYRMGSPVGVATGFGIYVDGEPYGHIGNKQTCWIKLPYGNHNVHIAFGMSRRCKDMQFTLSPDHPLECAKVHIKVGAFSNTFVIEPATNSEVPD